MNSTKLKPYQWRKVACPRCGALSGDPCTNVRGFDSRFVGPHVDRKLFAKGERLTGGILVPPDWTPKVAVLSEK